MLELRKTFRKMWDAGDGDGGDAGGFGGGSSDSDSGGFGGGGSFGGGGEYGGGFGGLGGSGALGGAWGGGGDSFGGGFGGGSDYGNTNDSGGYGFGNWGGFGGFGEDSSSDFGGYGLRGFGNEYGGGFTGGYSAPDSTSFGLGALSNPSMSFNGYSNPEGFGLNRESYDVGTKAVNDSIGWGDAAKNDAWSNSQFNPNTIGERIAKQEAYNQSPLASVTDFVSRISPYVGIVNPALGGMLGLGSMGIDAANRASYGASQNAAGIGGALGGLAGGMAMGPMGGVVGRSVGAGLGDYAANGNVDRAGQIGGGRFLGGISNAIGSAMAGPIGGMALGDLAGYAMAQQTANKQAQAAEAMMSRADPFGASRGAYGGQLNNLMQNPNAILQNPAYQAQYNQALKASTRAAAAEGKLGSGARVAALGNVAGTNAASAYNTEVNRLAQLAGANLSNPGAIQAALMMRGNAQDKRNEALLRMLKQLGG